MAYPGHHLRLVLQGTTYPGEIFTTSLSIVPVVGNDIPQPIDLAPLAAVCSSWFSNGGSRIPSLCKLTTIKLNRIAPNGKYADPSASFFFDYETPVAGGSSGSVPPQLTMAVTLETQKQRGLGARGRMFPPLVAPGIGTDGLVSETTSREIADSATAFITAINALDFPGVVGVASDVREGAFVRCTRVSVGRTIDTQRRRRSAMSDLRVLATGTVPQ